MKSKIKNILKLAITKEELIIKTERIVRIDNITYMDAIIHICEEYEIDPEDMAKLVKGPLKSKLEVEARRLNHLPKLNTISLE